MNITNKAIKFSKSAMSSPKHRHPGDPSPNFKEEKLIISEMLRKWNEIEEALPLLKSKQICHA